MHVYEVHAHEVHACEVHTYDMHALVSRGQSRASHRGVIKLGHQI
jgi:hypothetical protein